VPELPEVETTRAGIEPWIAGKTINRIVVRNPALRWPVRLPEDLPGRRVRAVRRRAKYLLIELEQGHLIVHLGMSGSLRIVDRQEPVKTHDHIDCEFAREDWVLRYNDPRRFGSWHYHDGEYATHWLLEGLGVEPLGNEFSGAHLHGLSRNRKVAVKSFIMDSKVVVGVGNIYAAEALFLAGIRPGVAAGRIPAHAYEKLALTIKQVLMESVRQGGTTLRDFVGSNGEPGYFRQRLHVYGREGQPCRVCGAMLKGKVIGQRSTVYCPNCQRSQGFHRD
jgi:formamidopyrimidine-DNA glycosylase